jgi:ribosomal protein S18 acetylase RimI-like enzyme
VRQATPDAGTPAAGSRRAEGWQDLPVPLFAPFQPDVRGSVDDRVAIRPATTADVAGIPAVAATRGALREGFANRVATWADDTERLVVVAEASDPVGDDEAEGATAVVANSRDRAEDDQADGTTVVVGWGMVARWPGQDDVPDGHFVSALTVHPTWWRRGVGERIAGELMGWTRDRGESLWSVVNARNGASLALHRECGFVEVRRAPSLAGVEFDGGEGVLLRAVSVAEPA